MNTYACYIKSHCEAPDFEVEVEARSRKDATNQILKRHLGSYGWEYPEVYKYTRRIDE